MEQRYIIFWYNVDVEPAMTAWMSDELFPVAGAIAVDTHTGEFTRDGRTWEKLKADHL